MVCGNVVRPYYTMRKAIVPMTKLVAELNDPLERTGVMQPMLMVEVRLIGHAPGLHEKGVRKKKKRKRCASM